MASRHLALALLALPALAAGCFPTDQGPPPPDHQLYFPTGLAVSKGGTMLYVANSDFDLQYKAGTVQVLDLERVRAAVPKLWDSTDAASAADACRQAGLSPSDRANALLFPGACTPIDLVSPPDGQGPILKNTVRTGAFASDAMLVYAPRDPACDEASSALPCPELGARLLVPVRGDPSLTYIDVDDDRPVHGAPRAPKFTLECGQASTEEGRCALRHEAGIDPSDNTRGSVMPSEPFGIAANEAGTAIVVTHQTSGAASLFLNVWPGTDACTSGPDRPTLTFVLGGLALGAAGVTSVPRPLAADRFGYPYQPAYLVSYRNFAAVDVLRYADDCTASPARPYLALTARAGINTNSGGYDSRGIALDTRGRREAEAACAVGAPTCATCDVGAAGCAPCEKERGAYDQCLLTAASRPIGVYVANRAPASLIIGESRSSVSAYGTDDSVYMYDQLPLSEGPSRLYVARVIGHDGLPHARVFVVCFDSRLIYVYDPEAHAMEGIIRVGRGPSAIAFDPHAGPDAVSGHGAIVTPRDVAQPTFAYVAHFTDSYLGVVDLDMRHPSTYLTVVASVAVPVAPREAR